MEVHVRVPLEKEVPLTLVIEEPKPVEEQPEFPELTEVRSLYLNITCTSFKSKYVYFFLHLHSVLCVLKIWPEIIKIIEFRKYRVFSFCGAASQNSVCFYKFM